MKTKHYLTYFIALFFLSLGIAQQDSQYTQYMYNMSVINPAYAKSDFKSLDLGLLHRQQWVDVVGAPTTSNFFAHYVLNEKMEIGTSIFKDEIGDDVLNETSISLDYAYILNLNSKNKLSLGIKAGINMFRTNFSDFELESGSIQTDPLFSSNESNLYPNVGVGAFFYSKKYYLGISTPNVIKSRHIKDSNGVYSISAEELHFYFTGGYVFKLNNSIKLKPSFLFKTATSSSYIADVSLNTLLYDKFEGGISYRLDESWSALINIEVLKGLRIGYAYDKTFSNIGSFSSGSHEFLVLYNFNLNTTNYKSPRFF